MRLLYGWTLSTRVTTTSLHTDVIFLALPTTSAATQHRHLSTISYSCAHKQSLMAFAPFNSHHDQTIPASDVMMNGTADAAVDSSQIVCRCGRDHRLAVTRLCPVFKALNLLHQRVASFWDAEELFQFGKDGPLAHGLRSMTLRRYDWTIYEFQRQQDASDQHPEWDLADELSRLRRYFDQIADGCAEESHGPRSPPSVVPEILSAEGSAVVNAKRDTIAFYDTCYDVISEWFNNGAHSLRNRDDHEGDLPMVDNAFKEAFEKITSLSKDEYETIQDLIKRLYELWSETRRLLFDFTPPSFLLPSPS